MKLNFLHSSRVLLCLAALFLFGVKANAQAPYCGATYFQGCGLAGGINDFIVNGDAGTSINDPATGCVGGSMGLPGSYYDDKTSLSVTFSAGSTYSLSSNLTSFFPAPIDLQVWIDFDNSTTFDVGEEIGGGTYATTGSTTFTLTIPAGAASGTHRMRAASSGGATYPGIDPCPTAGGSGTIGETHDYTVVIGSSCPVPVVTLGAATCSTRVINWTAAAGATGYEYVRNTTATSPASGTAIPATPTTTTESGLAAGTTYYAHIRTNCGGGSFSAWVNTPFTAGGPGAITGNPATCPGTPTQLSNSLAGGVWSSSNTAAATVSATGQVWGVASGATTITYTAGGCSATFAMNVGNLPAIIGTTSVCPNGTTQLSNAVPGGTWSSSNPAIASVNGSGFVTASSTSGTTVITYTASGCSNTVTVTVGAVPAIIGGSTVCVGATVALSNSATGGTWTSSAAGTASVNGSGVVTGVAIGTATITYSLGSCNATKVITVDAAIAPITGTAIFCITGGTTLASTTAGGTWSSSAVTVATVSGTGAVGGLAAGTATISYTKGGCSVTLPITVEPNNGGTITGSDTLCKGPGHEAHPLASVTGGTWSTSNTSRATVDPATGTVTGVTSGTSFILTYTVTNTCGTFTVTKPMYVRTAAKCATGIDPTSGSDVADLKVFPNPNSGTFTVNLLSATNEEVHIVITNIVGAKVKEFTTTTNTKLDIELAVPAGMYLLNASTAHDRYVKRIVVEK